MSDLKSARLKQLDTLKELQSAYRKCFSGESGRIVLEDLERRSFRDTAMYSGDETQFKINEGKRQMFNHIRAMSNMDLAKLRALIEGR